MSADQYAIAAENSGREAKEHAALCRERTMKYAPLFRSMVERASRYVESQLGIENEHRMSRIGL